MPDHAAGGRSERRVETHERHHHERRAGHQDRLQQAEVELFTKLAALKKADRDRHRKDEQRGDQHPKVVNRQSKSLRSSAETPASRRLLSRSTRTPLEKTRS